VLHKEVLFLHHSCFSLSACFAPFYAGKELSLGLFPRVLKVQKGTFLIKTVIFLSETPYKTGNNQPFLPFCSQDGEGGL